MQFEGGETVEAPSTDSELRMGPPGPPFGIVINGSSLVKKLYFHACNIVNLLCSVMLKKWKRFFWKLLVAVRQSSAVGLHHCKR